METQMNFPKMILFDYGQTLVNEAKFNGIKGTEAVLKYATENKYGLTAVQVQAEAEKINKELGRFDPERNHILEIEIPNSMFTSFLYESQGIKISLSNSEIDTIFWDAAAPGTKTEGIVELLNLLKEKGIRTGVISNIAYAPEVVEKRINLLLPENNFEFIITSSNYMYRKPNRRIFELALQKADLNCKDVWYVGDQYECDVKGAIGAGLFPIWYKGAINLPHKENKNILTIESWKELINRISL